MMCTTCLVESRIAGITTLTPAMTLFNGQALCLNHLDAALGLSAPSPQAARTQPLRPTPPSARAQTPEQPRSEHEPCNGDCDSYESYHYISPNTPHCACGGALVDGVCDTTLQKGSDTTAYEHLIGRG